MNLLHELWPDNPFYLLELVKHADGPLNVVNDKVIPLFLNVLKHEYVMGGMGMGNHARIPEFSGLNLVNIACYFTLIFVLV